jgi:DNA-binding transcriptional LysR family regulator
MDLHQLRTFVAVAQERHLTRAAERLHLSQPTASAHIRALEQSLELSLFVRRSNGLELTRAGELLLHRAEALLDDAMEFRSLARSLGGSIAARLTIGSNADPVTSRVGRLVHLLQERHPLLELAIELRSTAAILRGLRAGELDAGFFLGRQPEDSLDCTRLGTLTYRVAGPRAWKDQIEQADLRALALMPWILTPPGNSHADMLLSLFHGCGLAPRLAVEASNDLVIRTLVADGVGLALVRADHAMQGERDGTMSLSPIARAQTDLLFAFRRGRREEPAIAAMVEAVGAVWGNRGGAAPELAVLAGGGD